MPVTAKLRYLRISPRKVRLVADLIRGKSVEEAQTVLRYTIKKSSQPLLKLLKSAISNAKNNFQLSEDNLYISKITVNEGPKYKRWMPRARGQAYEIQKKTSHVALILDEIREKPLKKIKKAKPKVVKKEEIREKEVKTEKPLKDSGPKIGTGPTGQAKFKPGVEIAKPRIEKGIKRIFRRKAF